MTSVQTLTDTIKFHGKKEVILSSKNYQIYYYHEIKQVENNGKTVNIKLMVKIIIKI